MRVCFSGSCGTRGKGTTNNGNKERKKGAFCPLSYLSLCLAGGATAGLGVGAVADTW